jgi:hypothetical protein
MYGSGDRLGAQARTLGSLISQLFISYVYTLAYLPESAGESIYGEHVI